MGLKKFVKKAGKQLRTNSKHLAKNSFKLGGAILSGAVKSAGIALGCESLKKVANTLTK